MITNSRPMPPAIRPAVRYSRPNWALTFTDSARSKASGRAPNFSELARAAAEAWVNEPEISVPGVVIGPLILGAEITCPSNTMAVRVPVCVAVYDDQVE